LRLLLTIEHMFGILSKMMGSYLQIVRVSVIRLWVSLIIMIGVLAVLLTGCSGTGSSPQVATLKTVQGHVIAVEKQVSSNHDNDTVVMFEMRAELELIRYELAEIKKLLKAN